MGNYEKTKSTESQIVTIVSSRIIWKITLVLVNTS